MHALQSALRSELGIRVQRGLLPRILSLPESVLRRLAGPVPRIEGVELDVPTAFLLAQQVRAGLPRYEDVGVAEARRLVEVTARVVRGREVGLAAVRAVEVARRGGPTLPARLYVPRGLGHPPGLLVYLHGGGFTVGSVDTHDAVTRHLARSGRCLVLSVDYRLAPEHPFPVPVEDALEAFRWARAHAEALGADPRRVALGGDSAGGTLTAATTLLLREAGEPQPTLQLLIYPTTDARHDTISFSTYARGFFLDASTVRWFQEQYVPPGSDLDDFRLSPLRARDHRGLAPAYVQTAGFDPLRDEGRAYVEALRRAGVEATLDEAPGLTHGYANMAGVVPGARRALARAGAALVRALA